MVAALRPSHEYQCEASLGLRGARAATAAEPDFTVVARRVCSYMLVLLEPWGHLSCCALVYFVDSHWILLSADSQGFIPLTFAASQMVVVRDGSLSTPELARGSPSHNRDPILPPGGFGDFAAQSADTAGCFSSVA